MSFSSEKLDTSFRACRAITRHHAKSFYLASHALPRGKRLAAYAIYAFCRHIDDEIDHAPNPAAVTAALHRQRTLLHTLEKGQAQNLPWAPAFLVTCRWANIPRTHLEDLLIGMTLDQGPVRLADWPALDRYCHHVAGVVGHIMTHLFVHNPDQELLTHAHHLGTAMQLTNILRDIGEDLGRNRIYLPASELAEHRVTENDLRAKHLTENFRNLMRFQIARARDFYLRAEPGIARLPNDGTQHTVRTMSKTYAAILDQIEKNNYDIFTQRARVSLPRKIILAYRAWIQSRAQP